MDALEKEAVQLWKKTLGAAIPAVIESAKYALGFQWDKFEENLRNKRQQTPTGGFDPLMGS